MNQSDLIAKVAAGGGMCKGRATSAVDAVLGAIFDALKAGEKGGLSSLGMCDINDLKAPKGRNSATGALACGSRGGS